MGSSHNFGLFFLPSILSATTKRSPPFDDFSIFSFCLPILPSSSSPWRANGICPSHFAARGNWNSELREKGALSFCQSPQWKKPRVFKFRETAFSCFCKLVSFFFCFFHCTGMGEQIVPSVLLRAALNLEGEIAFPSLNFFPLTIYLFITTVLI